MQCPKVQVALKRACEHPPKRKFPPYEMTKTKKRKENYVEIENSWDAQNAESPNLRYDLRLNLSASFLRSGQVLEFNVA